MRGLWQAAANMKLASERRLSLESDREILLALLEVCTQVVQFFALSSSPAFVPCV